MAVPSRQLHGQQYYPNPFGCDTCSATFRTRWSCEQHMNAKNHWTRYSCDTCVRWFFSQDEADQHMNQLGHRAAAPHDYCDACEREFVNDNNLRMHLNSRTHRGADVPCPYCRCHYTCASGLLHHLETGACPDARHFDRYEILREIRYRDRRNAITLPYSMCSRYDAAGPGANAHSRSSRYWTPVYRCPNEYCGKTFVSLAGCFGHLESEACGFMGFEEAQDKVFDVLDDSQMEIAF